MNVSSVKNLNGETFSAVQDVYLTDVVSNNSANWNEISAYQANSGTFLTAHQDLSDYQTVEGMTAYQPAGDYITTADSANFYTTANESGFITGVGDTYLQNTDLTISDGKITEISGVPLSAGDEFPQSATEAIETVTANSADWNGTTDTVSSNSGAWGGSALPISAGPGIKFEMVNDTLVASIDETVLWEGTAFTPAGSNSPMLATAALSESIDNFDKIRLDFSGGFYFADSVLLTHPVTSKRCYLMVKKEQADGDTYIGTVYRFLDDTTLSGFCSYGTTQIVDFMTGGYWGYGGVCRVVGINRIAGGN